MSNPWIDYLKTVDSPTLSNGIELLGLRPRHEGFTPLQVRCLFPEFGRMVGYAVFPSPWRIAPGRITRPHTWIGTPTRTILKLACEATVWCWCRPA